MPDFRPWIGMQQLEELSVSPHDGLHADTMFT